MLGVAYTNFITDIFTYEIVWHVGTVDEFVLWMSRGLNWCYRSITPLKNHVMNPSNYLLITIVWLWKVDFCTNGFYLHGRWFSCSQKHPWLPPPISVKKEKGRVKFLLHKKKLILMTFTVSDIMKNSLTFLISAYILDDDLPDWLIGNFFYPFTVIHTMFYDYLLLPLNFNHENFWSCQRSKNIWESVNGETEMVCCSQLRTHTKHG